MLRPALTAFAALISVSAGRADEVADFYAAHPLTIAVGYSAGSGYDLLARTLARYIGRSVPGAPNVIVVNQPGAGSLTLANQLFGQARRDGTEIATFGRSIFMEPLFGNPSARFDPTKIAWIGNIGPEASVCVAWHASPVKSWDDLFKTRFVAGANAPGSDTGVFANLLKRGFGAKIEIVNGYPGGAEITRAIENGEIDGRCGWSVSALLSTKPDWLSGKKINVLVQMAATRHPALGDVPVLVEFAKSQRQRDLVNLILRRQDVAWPYAAPPDVPPDRLAALREAFAATVRDPAFIKSAQSIGVEVRPMSADEMARVVADVYAAPRDIVDEARAILSGS